MKIFKTLLLFLCMQSTVGFCAKSSNPDTLIVVQKSPFLRYPLGKFENFKSFDKKAHIAYSRSMSSVIPYENGIEEKTKIFYAGKSYARFYPDRKSKNLEMVNSIIVDGELQLQNGVNVGIDRMDFLKKLNIGESYATKASVIDLTSEDGNIHHYYSFQNDKLIRIVILSKLFYQKK